MISVAFSCSTVLFEQPQPVGTDSLDKFPDDWQGKYSSDSTIFTIGDNYLEFNIFGKHSKYFLSDSFILKPYYDDRYVLNFIMETGNDSISGKYWLSFLMKKSKDKISVYTVSWDKTLPEKLAKYGIEAVWLDKEVVLVKSIDKEKFDILVKKKFFVPVGVLKKIQE